MAKDISKYKDVDNFKPSIKMYGKVNDEKKIMLLKDSNFLILPSLSRAEAYGLVLLEAMRLGVPIITNNLKGSGVIELNSDYESKPVGFKFDSSNRPHNWIIYPFRNTSKEKGIMFWREHTMIRKINNMNKYANFIGRLFEYKGLINF